LHKIACIAKANVRPQEICSTWLTFLNIITDSNCVFS
jgi:hypothetical protein